jgi:hypothetical protein
MEISFRKAIPVGKEDEKLHKGSGSVVEEMR